MKIKSIGGSKLSSELTTITSAGRELIICTDHYYESNVFPYHYSRELEMFQIRTRGSTSDIKCYVKYGDSALREAVTMFHSWITQNGGSILGLNEDKLIELVQNT